MKKKFAKSPEKRERLKPFDFGLLLRRVKDAAQFERLIEHTLSMMREKRRQGWKFLIADFIQAPEEHTTFHVTAYRVKVVGKKKRAA